MRFQQVRFARPVADIDATTSMYCRGLGLAVIGSFADHDGFDGVMLGEPGAGYHFEFTRSRRHPVAPAPTVEDVIVFYIPDLSEWAAVCDRMVLSGFESVESFNPYWDVRGRTFRDLDGYRVVLQHEAWMEEAAADSR